MITTSLHVRRAVAQDHLQIASLVFHEANTHRHLDWRSALEWIGSQNYWVLEENGMVAAALACPEDPPNVAWIRLFAHQPHLSGLEAWSALWERAHTEIESSNPRTQIAAIILKQWFQTMLLSSGFEMKQDIILLQLRGEQYRPPAAPSGFRIRRMEMSDLLVIAQVDLEAFGPFWHNTLDALQRARSQAIHATVAETETGVIGYQISTGNPVGAHLARLGVRPEAQGRGVGTALVRDLVQWLEKRQAVNISVNTQADNTASLALYQKLGFVRTGEYFPVFVYPLESKIEKR